MLPANSNIGKYEFVREPSLTYEMDFSAKEDITRKRSQLSRYIDGLDSVRQAVFKILCTDRYVFEIYNWDYGFEIDDLFGKDRGFVKPELKRRIREALLTDDRIKEVIDFAFEDTGRTTLHIYFTVKSIFGDLYLVKDVIMNV